MIVRSIIYGFSGMCMESIFTGLKSLRKGDKCLACRTYLWMWPIYAAAVLLEPVHEHIRYLPLVVRGLIYLLLIWSAELITGWLLKKIIGCCPWDYSKATKCTLGGFIRWDYAPAWFMVGLLFEQYHDLLMNVRLV